MESSDIGQTPTGNLSTGEVAGPIACMTGVSKSFGSHEVIRNLDLTIQRGEKVAIMGPSGSGKTTILRLLVGLERPDAGKITIGGRTYWERPSRGRWRTSEASQAREVRRNVGMVFQQFNLFPHMDALSNVVAPLVRAQHLDKVEARRRAESVLTSVGLAEHLTKRPGQLSGGQQQRVAIARALALRPTIMLFDEVTSALDPEMVGEVLNVIRLLANETDMSMALSTHEVTFAQDVADRVVIFDAGQIVEQGPPETVLKTPQNERTRRFLKAVLER